MRSSITFFRCAKGHAEQFHPGMADGPGIPWRPCSICHGPMTLEMLCITNGGKLCSPAAYKASKAARRLAMPVDIYKRTNKPRIVKPITLLKRFMKRLNKIYPYVVMGKRVRSIDESVTIHVGKRDDTIEVGKEQRHVVVTAHLGHKITFEAVGVIGWLKDFKLAAKGCRAEIIGISLRQCEVVVLKNAAGKSKPSHAKRPMANKASKLKVLKWAPTAFESLLARL